MKRAGVEGEPMSAEEVFAQVGEAGTVPEDVGEISVKLPTVLASVGAVESEGRGV